MIEGSVWVYLPAAAPVRPPAFEIEVDMPEHEEEMPGMENME